MGAAGRSGRWIVGICAAIAVGLGGMAACTMIFRWEDDVLPRVLGPARLIGSEREVGFREGCSYAVYRLADDVVQKIRDRGLAFFGSDTHPPWDDPRNPYGVWQQTPIAGLAPSGNHSIYAFNAESGCKIKRSGNAPLYTVDAWEIAARPGSYYLLTRNKEGMVLVIPELSLALYLYFG